MTRLYLHPLIQVGVGYFGFTILMDIASPMDFIIVSIAFRWSILVVEPSPLFQDRSLAADCPIFSFFNRHACRFQLRCGKKSSKGFPAIHPIIITSRYQLGRLCLLLLMQLKHNQRHGYEIPQQLSFQMRCSSY